MKSKRRVRTMYNRMLDDGSPEAALGSRLFAWLLEESEENFEDIIPHISEPKPRLSTELFAYDTAQEVWVMKDPLSEGRVYISDSRPKYMPETWWEKKGLDDVSEEITFGEDPIGLVSEFGSTKSISWVEIEKKFQQFRTVFHNRNQVEKYILHFYDIDYSDRILVPSSSREAIAEETGAQTTALKVEIERMLNADLVYIFKQDGDRIWAMKERD